MKSLITLTLATALSSAALAQQPQPSTQPDSQRSPSTATQQAAPSAAPAMDLGQIFDRLNSSHTGKMTKSEAQAHPAVAANFDAADANHDGVLSKEEFLAAFRPAQ
jgi:hypothetical protein